MWTRTYRCHCPNTTGLDIEHWHNSPKPTLNGQVLKLYSHEISRSVAVSSKADVFLLGADWRIRLFDKTGREKWHVNVPAGAFAVNLTGDGRYAVAALEDGSIRWYAVESGHEVMGLFIDADGKRWVLWTPEGFFDCSAASDALVGYHVHRGPDHDGEFVRDDQLSFLLFRSHLLSARLSAEGDELVKAEVAHIGDVYEALQSGLPPEVASLSPAESESDGKLTLQYRVIDRGGGIGDVVYRIDRAVMAFRPVGPLPEGKDTVGREFDLPPGRHVVTVTVYNRSNKVESRSISAVVNVRNTQTQQKLYVVAVGISRYRDAGAVPLLVGICVYIFIERGCPELR